MGIRIEEIPRDDRDTWNRAVDRSPQTTFFHQHEALVSLAEYFDAELRLLAGYVGQEQIGIFPVFGQSKGPFDLVTSPPLSVEIHAGPALLNFEKLKQRKAEQRHQRFVDGCLEWIEAVMEPDLYQLKIPRRYSDLRPFLRRDFDVDLSYTYVLDLEPDLEDLRNEFSSDARRNIRNTPDDAYEIEEGGAREIDAIVSLIRERFDHLDEYYYLDSSLVKRMYDAEDESVTVRPYTCRVDGDVVSGIIVLEFDDTVYRWQGGSKPDVDIPVTELLDWRIITDAKARDKRQYDLVGAMIPRLCEYKSKFSPEPAPLYIASKGTIPAKAVEYVYRRVPTNVRRLVGL